MPTIDSLSQISSIADADELPLFSKQNGDMRKVTAPQLAAYVLDAIAGTPDNTVYSLNTSTVTILPATPGGDVWAQITLSSPLPALTAILPTIDVRAHGQEVLVTCTQAVAALTLVPGDAGLSGAPIAAGPTTPFRLKYDSPTNTWYRI